MPFGQTFELFDLMRVSFLFLLELLLSADNAIILGLLTRSLPVHQRKQALFIGLLSAVIFRAAGLLLVSTLLRFTWIQLIAALYLLYLAIRHHSAKEPPLPQTNFWKVVFLVEFFDLAFAIDSIVAGVAFISSIPSTNAIHPKLWIVFAGALLGLVAIRSAAKLFSNLIDRFPRLEHSAYYMIGWIGLKLGANATLELLHISTPWIEIVFWPVLILLFLSSFIPNKTRRHG